MIVAVIPEPSSPKNGRPPSAPRCRQPAEPNPARWRSATLHRSQTADVWGARLVLFHPAARGGVWWLPIPSAQSVEGQRGTIPPFRRSEGSARYPPRGLQALVTWAGVNTVCGLEGRVRVGEEAPWPQRPSPVVRQAGVPAGGWLGTRFDTLLYVVL